jgi:hypothetical protein
VRKPASVIVFADVEVDNKDRSARTAQLDKNQTGQKSGLPKKAYI